MLRSNTFHSNVHKPTTITATSSTLLKQQILINDTISQNTPGILKSDISEHFSAFVLIKNVDNSLCFGKQILQIQSEFQA